MSRELGLSRAAVWKKIETLRGKGFAVEAVPAKGYRLTGAPEFSLEELETLIEGEVGKNIVFLGKADSTNDLAMRSASEGAPHGTVFIADSQTGGKGRLGRTWVSPAGVNIYMSVILRPELSPREATLLTLLSSVACATALRRTTGLEVSIKWPNDLMAGGRKLGGILLEMRSEPDRVLYAVVGIGININMKRNALPDIVRPIATSLMEETGKKHRRTPIAAEILNEIENMLKTLERKGRGRILSLWRELSSTLGKEVVVTAGDETLRGTATDIDDEGRLILKTKTGILTISAGDLTHLR